ncbi:hypothetical protein GCM10009535_28060 [Streptomyces thermocarboxydovorans]|uniref:Uncharacterized protein n=2 Tax=Streptomyces thermocarboxydovorans TaxID=59298 RepID=A0ABN1HH39_9ACTN
MRVREGSVAVGHGKRRRKPVTVGSFEPLGGSEPDKSLRDARDREVARFFQDVAGMVFRGGPRGMELTAMDVAARTFSFRHVGEPDSRALASEAGEVPDDDTERSEVRRTPQPDSPAWAHLACLLQELPFVLSFREYGPEGGPSLVGVESPGREYADVLVEHGGKRWRVRVKLEGREEPLQFPGMAIGELFGEGGHRDAERGGVVDAGI